MNEVIKNMDTETKSLFAVIALLFVGSVALLVYGCVQSEKQAVECRKLSCPAPFQPTVVRCSCLCILEAK
jgi:hypothetical protein